MYIYTLYRYWKCVLVANADLNHERENAYGVSSTRHSPLDECEHSSAHKHALAHALASPGTQKAHIIYSVCLAVCAAIISSMYTHNHINRQWMRNAGETALEPSIVIYYIYICILRAISTEMQWHRFARRAFFCHQEVWRHAVRTKFPTRRDAIENICCGNNVQKCQQWQSLRIIENGMFLKTFMDNDS